MPTIPGIPNSDTPAAPQQERAPFAVNSSPPQPAMPSAAAPPPPEPAPVAAAPAPAAANEDTANAVREYLTGPTRADPQRSARASLFVAMDGKPDVEAELREVSRRTGVPVDSIRAYPDAVKKQAAMQAIDFGDMEKRFPNTTAFLSNVENARISHDDVGGLSTMETLFNSFRRGVPGLMQGASGTALRSNVNTLAQVDAAETLLAQGKRGLTLEQDPQGVEFMSPVQRATFRAGLGQASTSNVASITGAQATKALYPSPPVVDEVMKAKTFRDAIGAFMADPVKFIAAIGPESLITSAPGLVGAAVVPGGLGVRVATMGAGSAATDYGSSIIEGLTRAGVNVADPIALQEAVKNPALMQQVASEAIRHAAVVGTFDAASGRLASALTLPGKLAAKMAKVPLAREVAGAAAQMPIQGAFGAAGEAGGELAAGQPLDPGNILAEFAGEAFGTPGEIAAIAHSNIVERVQAARDAQKAAPLIKQLTELSAASKVLQRDTTTFETFAQSLTEEGAKDLWISPDALMQSGVAEKIMALSPDVAAQMQSAVASNTDIRIPAAEFMGRLSKEGLAQSLVDHVKTEPEGMSKAEADVYMQEHGETLNAEVEKVLAQQQGDTDFATSRAAVQTDLTNKLNAAGRFTPDVNTAYSTLMANFFATQASRLGVTPEALYQQYTPTIVAQSPVGAAVLDQAASSLIDVRNAWTRAGITHAMNEKDGTIELGQIVVPKDAREQGVGTVAMQQLIAYADASGQRIVLTPSGDFGGTKSRLERFYKDFGFVQNKGRTKDFTTRATMIREPQTLRQQGDQADRTEAAAAGQGQDAAHAYDFGVESGAAPKKPAAARATYDPATHTIALLKGADLTSFLHESGHFYLEVLADLASKPDAPAAIKADMAALLDWFGIPGAAKTDEVMPAGRTPLETWNLMTLDEKREYHEQFARGFEAYLFEGNSPSPEVHGIFQRFRSWMLNVYKNIAKLNVKLTDEVRGVMDRLIATEEQIHAAEAARGMGLMFKDEAEAKQFGVDWAKYQAQGKASTEAAVEDLQTKGVRDMQWLSNARSRRLKQMQKQADNLRDEIERGVRAEVMSQPVYRAWAFLTGRDSAAIPTEPTAAEEGYKQDLRMWDEKRAEHEADVIKAARVAAWEASDESKVQRDPKAQGFAKGRFISANRKRIRLDVEGKMLDWEQANPKPAKPEPEPAEQTGPMEFSAGKIDTEALKAQFGEKPDAAWRKLSALHMTSPTVGLDPELVAETFGFTSADELVQAIAAAVPPKEVVSALTDQRMLEQHGELATPEGVQRATDEAIHNEVRSRMVATELAALEKAANPREETGKLIRTKLKDGTTRTRVQTIATLPRAARQFAADLIARTKVRDILPGQFSAAEARAARAAEKALKDGDIAEAAAQKRAQLINGFANTAAHDAKAEVDTALDYLARFAKPRKSIDPDYQDQIDSILERFDLRRGQSLRTIDKRKSLAKWIESQEDIGIAVELPEKVRSEAFRQSYKDMTVEEFRGVVEAVRQIEHLGRLKSKLLTAKTNRDFAETIDDLVASVNGNGAGRSADTRTPTTGPGRWLQAIKNFGAAHIKAATWARIMDGGQDGGPMWESFIRAANERGDMETTMRADATRALSEIMAPVLNAGKMTRKTFFPSVGRSFTRESVFTMALNTGNQGNLQRLLGGEGWTIDQLKPILDTLTADDWATVQRVWDYFETFRPAIAAKERRVSGVEPNWIEPTPVVTTHGTFKGGYFPIQYDPAASVHAEQHADAEAARQQLKGAYTAATTRRSFTKSRVEEVKGRPLLYTMTGLYGGVNDVIHDLAWHEWLIDTNRLLRNEELDTAMREHYGPAAVRQFKTWAEAIATGDAGSREAVDMALGRLRQSVSVAGLGFNVVSALMQPLGLTQSIVRVGPQWIGKGVMQYIASPVGKTREVNAQSDFMANRSRTRFRELNELRNKVQGQDAASEFVGRHAYWLMMRFQQLVDVPTWLGAYEKAIAGGNAEERAVSLADQAVIDAQGGGQTKDQSAIERGGPAQKLFTTFYSFMNTALNIGVAQGMTNKSAAKTAADLLLLYTVPAVLGAMLKDAVTPGDSGDEDEKLVKKLLGEQLGFLFGLFVIGREFGEAGKNLLGLNDRPRDYAGPAGVRMVSDTYQVAKQAQQGEFDDAFRKAAINLTGDLLGLPSAQLNRTITGAQALSEGKTQNPFALLTGYQEPR